jgi:hypothetical protein
MARLGGCSWYPRSAKRRPARLARAGVLGRGTLGAGPAKGMEGFAVGRSTPYATSPAQGVSTLSLMRCATQQYTSKGRRTGSLRTLNHAFGTLRDNPPLNFQPFDWRRDLFDCFSC